MFRDVSDVLFRCIVITEGGGSSSIIRMRCWDLINNACLQDNVVIYTAKMVALC